MTLVRSRADSPAERTGKQTKEARHAREISPESPLAHCQQSPEDLRPSNSKTQPQQQRCGIVLCEKQQLVLRELADDCCGVRSAERRAAPVSARRQGKVETLETGARGSQRPIHVFEVRKEILVERSSMLAYLLADLLEGAPAKQGSRSGDSPDRPGLIVLPGVLSPESESPRRAPERERVAGIVQQDSVGLMNLPAAKSNVRVLVEKGDRPFEPAAIQLDIVVQDEDVGGLPGSDSGVDSRRKAAIDGQFDQRASKRFGEPGCGLSGPVRDYNGIKVLKRLSAEGFQAVMEQVFPPPRRDDDRHLSFFVAPDLQRSPPFPDFLD